MPDSATSITDNTASDVFGGLGFAFQAAGQATTGPGKITVTKKGVAGKATPVDAPAQAVGQAASDVGSAVSATGKLVSFLTSPTNWLRIGEVIAGIILVVMGLRSLTGSTTSPVAVAGKAAMGAAAVME